MKRLEYLVWGALKNNISQGWGTFLGQGLLIQRKITRGLHAGGEGEKNPSLKWHLTEKEKFPLHTRDLGGPG